MQYCIDLFGVYNNYCKKSSVKSFYLFKIFSAIVSSLKDIKFNLSKTQISLNKV